MAKQNQKPVARPISDAAYRPVGDLSRNFNYDGTPRGPISWDTPLDNFNSTVLPLTGNDFYTGDRYKSTLYGTDYEEAQAQQQGFWEKGLNGITKFATTAGTTFLQTTAGTVNGLIQWNKTGNFTSFYDNDFNKSLDEFNKSLEDQFATYESKEFKDAAWWHPDYWFTGNFLWEGVVKNLGFAAGAAASGYVFGAGLSSFGKLAGWSRAGTAAKMADKLTKAEIFVKGGSDAQKLKMLADNFTTSYNILDKGYRATVAGLATTGEAGIEAYHNLNEYRDRAINAFREEYNRDPSAEEMAKINASAQKVGDWSFYGNMVLLTGTNYIQFPKIIGSSYKAEKGVMNQLAKSADDVVLENGKYIRKPSKLRGVPRTLNKIRPYTFSVSEAFEEGSQYAIGLSTETFWDKKYNEDASFTENISRGLEALVEGYKETLTTDEGMKNVLIGGLSGALMLGRGKYRENAIKDRNTTEMLRNNKWTNTGINSAKLTEFMSDTYDSAVRAIQIDNENQTYLKTGDVLNSKDAEADYIINYLLPRIKHGRIDLVFADINDYRVLAQTEDGWDQLIKDGIVKESDNKEAFLLRLDNFQNTAQNISSFYKALSIEYGGVLDEDGKKLYSNEVIDKLVYAKSKIADYDSRISQLSNELMQYNTAELIDAAVKENPEVLEKAKLAIDAIPEQEMTVTDKNQIKQKMADLSSISLRRSYFMKDYNAIIEEPLKFKDKTKEDIDVKEGEKIKVKTANKEEKEVVVGEPYYLVENYKPSRDGVKPVRKAHTVQLLKQNSDGSVEIQFENGTVKTVTPEQLSDYNLGSVESTNKNKKAKFVLDNLNQEFEHLGITENGNNRRGVYKDDTPAKGVLEYDTKADEVVFVWTTPKGDTFTRKVYGDLFVPKEGYSQGVIRETGETIGDPVVKAKSKKAFLSLEQKISRRTEVAQELYDSILKEITDIVNRIKANNTKLASLDKQIAEAFLTKSGKPRKRITKTLLDTVDELEKLKESIPVDNENLQKQQIVLEGELEYVKAFLDNVESTPRTGTEMINNIKQEIEDLEQMITLTKDAIKQTKRQLPLIEAIYKRALNLLNNFIDRIASLNPGIPLSMDKYRDVMASKLGEEVAEGIIERGEGFTAAILDIENTILSYSEGLKYPKYEERFQKMSQDLKELEDSLGGLEANLRAQQKILEAFREYWREENERKKTEEVLKDNAQTDEVISKTLDTDGGSADWDPDFVPNPLKATRKVPTSTRGKSFGKDHQERANTFGFNLPQMQEDGKNIMAVYVTSSTEKDLGMQGLMARLAEDENGAVDESIDQNDIIAVVMVTENEQGELVPVDVEGNPITEGNPIDTGIFQVMPNENLTQADGTSMFRPEVVKDKDLVKEITDKYKAWRTSIFSRPKIDSYFEPQASFGFLEFEKDEDGNKLHTLRTPVSDAGFIKEDAVLLNKQVLKIPTTELVVSKGSTEFKSRDDEQALYKRVLLETPNGYVQVKNQQISEKQSIVIYRALKQLAQDLVDNQNLSTVKSKALISYLKGVIYFGIPKTQEGKAKPRATNSVFFKKDKTTGTQWLYIGQDKSFEFSPTELRNREAEITQALRELYTNTNKNKVEEMSEDFIEILNINEQGDITESRTWPNYQSYLLSKYLPTEDGATLSNKERPNEEIPLITSAKPITESEPVNRTGIYFYNESLEEEYTVKEKQKLNFKSMQKAREVEQGVRDVPMEDIIAFVESSVNEEIRDSIRNIKNDAAREEKYMRYYIFSRIQDLYEADSKEYNDLSIPEKQSFIKEKLEEFISTMETKGLSLKEALNKAESKWQIRFSETPPVQEEVVQEEEEEVVEEEVQEDENELTLPEGYRIVEDGETIQAGDFDTRFDFEGRGITITNAPKLPTARRKRRSTGRNARGNTPRGGARIKLKNRRILKTEDWNFVENWLKENFPNIPFYRMKNIIKNTNGDQAWGLFRDASIYVYKNAEEGTTFHEVFEAIWAIFTTPEEKAAILKEFRGRTGTFVDRPTGKTIAYKDASDFEAKEELAEEFRRFMLKTAVPQKTKDNFILKAFKDLIKLIKTLFLKATNRNKINSLFKKINAGGYKNRLPNINLLNKVNRIVTDSNEDLIVDSFEGDFSMLPGLTDIETDDIVSEMIYNVIEEFINSGDGLFDLNAVKITDDGLKQYVWNAIQNLRDQNDDFLADYSENKDDPEYEGMDLEDVVASHEAEEIALDQLVKSVNDNWADIKLLFSEKIRVHGFEYTLTEDDVAQIENIDKIRNSDYVDATKVDKFKKMNKALKLLLSTVARTTSVLEEGKEVTKIVQSSIGGVKTLPFTTVANTLMKNLHRSVDIMDMIERFRDLAEENPNYRSLYTDFTGLVWTDDVSLKKVRNMQDFRLISGLWKTFSLAAPKVKNVFILEDGSIQVGDANLSTEAIQLRNTYINNITLRAKSGQGFLKYSSKNGGMYEIDRKKLGKYPLGASYTSHYLFLKELGIDFSVQELQKLSKKQWADLKAINSGMRTSLNKLYTIKSFSSKILNLHSNALLIALLKASVSNNAYESTYFNVAGERTQTFIGTNATARLEKILDHIDNINQLEGTEYEYLIPGKDKFTTNSAVISKMFDLQTGEKREVNLGDVQLLTSGYAGGTINNRKGKNTTSSNLKFRDRLIQEINLNLEGWYMNLVPGDSSTEWMTYIGNFISTKNLSHGYGTAFRIIKGYFIDEVNLSRETDRDIFVDKNEKLESKRKDLRFFKDILDETTLNTIRRSRTKDAAQLYEENKEAIEKAVINYIELNSGKLERTLRQYGLIKVDPKNKSKKTIEGVNLDYLSDELFLLELNKLSLNYMIANIEMHKVIYGDPYQYKDELKRTKSFQSPRQEVLNSSNEINSLMDEIWNKEYKKGSLGWTNFLRDYFKTITYSDVNVISKVFDAYGVMDETDGGGIINLKAYRNFKIRSSDWTKDNEAQYRYEMKWAELYKAGKIKEANKLVNPKVRDTFTAIKPVVTGNRKHNGTYNKIVLDKYSLYPISYRMMVEFGAKNGEALYDYMEKNEVDYAIFKSGRKVGAYSTINPYTAEGKFNNQEITDDDIINIPFYAMGLQTEVPSKDENNITRGSQVTKIITMDRMDVGVPIDFESDKPFPTRYKKWNQFKTEEEKVEASELYKEIVNNRKLLQAQIEFGYSTLLRKLGIKESINKAGQTEWLISDLTKTSELIKNEVLKRETNNNIIAALNKFREGSSVLEATPAYRQISNVLYSIVDKNIARPKINGSMKVQIPSTFWEENRLGISEFNGKKGYTSDALGFYSEEVVDEKTGKKKKINVMEIFIGRWFDSNMNDQQLLDYLNTTKEGQKILEGFAFRIPTQNMNSIDAFRIKKFLPEEFGDNVVVPSALVGKVGSDFDIDKLSIYLKNVFDKNPNKPVLVPNFSIGQNGLQEAINWAEDYLYDKLEWAEDKLNQKSNLQQLFGDLALNRTNQKTKEKWIPIFKRWYADELIDGQLPVYTIENIFIDTTEKLGKTVNELSNKEVIDSLSRDIGIKLYQQGLQNAYIESNINLLRHPSNFEKLTSPNDASSLEKLSDEIVQARGETVLNYKTPINMLDRVFMTELRHDFVAGKKGIGIAATGQTNHANNQGIEITIDPQRLELVDDEEKEFLGKADIKFAPNKYNWILKDGKRIATLSKRESADSTPKKRKYISDTLGMFIDGFVDIANGPWIMRLGATPEVVGTWLFLIKIGVPIRDVAYFMNQPIIREYLQMIQNKGYSWLFIRDYADQLKLKYPTSYKSGIDEIPSVEVMKETINKNSLNSIDNAYQQFYLDEFLKYSMMGRHLFYFIQGTNFDTSNFNNPYLLTKKARQLEKAQRTIISSVEDFLNNSFIGTLRNSLLSAREALKEILISDRRSTRNIVERVLEPYIDMNDRDYVKMAEKVITSLFDWAVQTQTGKYKGLNNDLLKTLVDKGNAVQKLSAFIKQVKANPNDPLYGNYVIENAEIIPSKSAEPGSPDNVKIKAISTEVYEQNKMIYAFREIRDELGKDSEIYNSLVKIALLQSGLSPSTISFTSYIPFEDFEPFYNEALMLLEDRADLQDYLTSNVFQRNNWHDSNVAEYKRAEYIEALNLYNPGMGAFRPKNVNAQVKQKLIPEVLQVRVGRESRSDWLVYSWEDYNILTQDEIRLANDRGIDIRDAIRSKKEALKNAGDFSFVHKALMKKVLLPNGEPFVHTYTSKQNITYQSHVYRAVNAWGMGNRANEYYSIERQSVLNNGFDKVENEGTDADIISAYTGGVNSKSLGLPLLKFTGDNPSKVLKGIKTTTLRNYKLKDGTYNVDGRPVNVKLRGYFTVKEAGGVEAISKTEAFGEDGPLFPSTKEWLKGVGKMYVYDLSLPEKTSGGALSITVKGDRVTINNKTFPMSFMNADKLVSLGYTEEQAGEILQKTKYKDC